MVVSVEVEWWMMCCGMWGDAGLIPDKNVPEIFFR